MEELEFELNEDSILDDDSPFGEEQEEVNNDNNEADEQSDDDIFGKLDQESVGEKSDNGDTKPSEKDNSASSIYSSMLKALKDDGVFPELDDEFINGATGADAIMNAINMQIEKQMDETQLKIKKALEVGVEPDVINQYENTINYIDSISNDDIESEEDSGQDLRKKLIYNNYVNSGIKPEKAEKLTMKSIQDGTDIEDAKDAVSELKEYYKNKYDEAYNSKLKEQDEIKKQNQKKLDELKSMIDSSDEPIPGIKLDKNTRKTIYETIAKPIGKNQNGQQISKLQQYSEQNPEKMQFYTSMFFNLTDGFTNIDKLVKGKVDKAKKEHVSNLERVLNNMRQSQFDSGYDFSGRDRDEQSTLILDI